MKRFFVVTGGRTGSTAAMDILGKLDGIEAAQELFLRTAKNFPGEAHPVYPPWLYYNLKQSYVSRILDIPFGNRRLLRSYLDMVEGIAASRGAKAFGFKVLSNNFVEIPALKSTLHRQGYLAVHLTRDPGWQALSYLVAEQRGKYNTKDASAKFGNVEIDIRELEKVIQHQKVTPQMEFNRLKKQGFQVIQISFDDFVSDRRKFLSDILVSLDLPLASLPDSDYQVMIKDPSKEIANFQEVRMVFDKLGVAQTSDK